MDDYSVAVDVGGTFTDIVLCNLATNEQWVHKTPSTPEDPSTGFLTGLREVLDANSVCPAQVKHVFHGTTIANRIRNCLQFAPDIGGPVTLNRYHRAIVVEDCDRAGKRAGERQNLSIDFH